MVDFLKKLVAPLHLKDSSWLSNLWPFSPSGYRLFSITILQYKTDTTPASEYVRDYTLLRVNGPAKGTHMFENALLHFAIFAPFGVALTLKVPHKHNGVRWGHTLTFQVGWKTTGNLSGVARYRPAAPMRDANGTLWRPYGFVEGKH